MIKSCFKSLENPSCIDVFLTNSHNSFKHSTVLSVGLSNFHKMIVTVMKTTFVKEEPKLICYRDFKRYDDLMFRVDLNRRLTAPLKRKDSA